MAGLSMDLRNARRALVAAPGFSMLAIGTLALGVASVTAVFGVVEGVLLRPLPFPEPERLVEVLRTDAEGATTQLSWPDFRDWAELAEGFDGIAGYTESTQTFEWEGGAESVTGARVTRNYFDVMGVPLQLGRTFTEDEDALGGPRAIILSHALWTSRFLADPEVIGRTVPLAEGAVPIVGVAAADFSAPDGNTRFWMPMQADQLLVDVGLPTGGRSLSFIDAVGRLRSGADMASVSASLRALGLRIDAEAGKSEEQLSRAIVVPLAERMVGEVRATLLLLLWSAALVLLVAAANVGGLAFSRRLAREREMAVRTALGATRGRLVRQLLSEGALVALCAGTTGFALAWAGQATLLRLAPPGLPRMSSIDVGPSSLVFAAAATVASGLIFGLLPSFGVRGDPAEALGGRGQSAGRSALRPQRILVTVQLAVAVVLLAGAAALTSSFVRLLKVDRGFETESLIVATVAPSEQRYGSPEEMERLYVDILDHVRALPGVLHASTTYSPPLFGNDFRTSVVREGEDADGTERFWAGTVIIGDDYFAANGIELLRGRSFGPDDRLGAPTVVIVNQTMAERLWPGEDPLGRRIEFSGGLRGTAESFDRAFFPDEPMTVVGVAADVRRSGLDEPPAAEYYRPHGQLTWGFQYLLVRTEGDPSDVASELRAAVWSVDAAIPVNEVRTMREQVATSVAAERFRLLLIGVFAILTALLAMVGLYAVMSLAVARRLREMGIRLALGASRGSVVRGAVREGAALVAVGLVAGVTLALGIARLLSQALSGMLFEVAVFAPTTWIGVVAVTGAVGLLATWIPARRAARVDPVVSLRSE